MKTENIFNLFITFILCVLVFFFLIDLYEIEFSSAQSDNDKKNNTKVSISSQKNDIRIRYYSWQYSGKNYYLKLKLHESIYDYYKDNNISPTKIQGNISYRQFLRHDYAEGLFSTLASKLRDKALENSLTQDQLAELTVAFVQAIPYDYGLAKKIENQTTLPKHPYEVLYEKSGVCSGKSFLTFLLLDMLDFGTCLFRFDRANHMMAGIKCLDRYSSFNSGYCYIETTSYFPVGFSKSDFDQLNVESIVTKYSIDLMSSWNILHANEGNKYNEIVRNKKLLDEAKQIYSENNKIKKRLKNKAEELKRLSNHIKDLKNKLQRYKKRNQRRKYKLYANKYNNLVSKANNMKDNYNELSNYYNKRSHKYNAAINELLIQKGS